MLNMASKRNSENSCGNTKWMRFIILVTIISSSGNAYADTSVPAIYVFGDSTADVGTNNYLAECGAKANMAHHGIDYPGSKPTGRFSNGYNTIDFLAQFLGFKESPPPYLYLLQNQRRSFTRSILSGANFASGGAGLLDLTGKRPYKKVIPISEQIKQFSIVRGSISKVLGGNVKADDRISKSLFLISVGSNDIIEHFLFDQIPPKGDQFVNNLLSTYENHLRRLIKLGAKRFGLLGLSPIGCIPIIRIRSAKDGCLESMNEYAKQFNLGLEAILKKLSMEGAKPMRYSMSKAYDMTLTVLNDPTSYGFKDGKSACCGNGKRLNAEEACKPDSKVCKDRKTQLFWDQFHPTETAYKLAAFSLYNGGSHLIAPQNISQLATLKF